MSAKHAVLGLVIERPAHGYDLARRLRERFGFSGFAPTGVYSALDQLSSEALVHSAGSSVTSAGERAAPRTVYEATPKGIEHFERWMLGSSALAPVRDELYMKLALSRPQDLPHLIELTRSQEELCLSRLQNLKRPLDTSTARGAIAWPEVAGLLVRDAEIKQLQGRVEWLQRARAIMDKACGARRQQPSPGAGELRATAGTNAAAGAGGSPTAGVRVA